MSVRRGRTTNPARLFAILGVLAVVVGGGVSYLAYTANSGLPWQSRYEVNVDVRDAHRLIGSADVRVAGVRVGQVQSVTAQRRGAYGRPYARLHLALDPGTGPLPVDTTAQVRPASVLGLTYVDLVLGRSRRTISAGGTLPVSRARPTVDLTDLYQVFDRRTAKSFQSTLTGFAGGFAGEGAAVNSAIGSFSRLLVPATDVARVLAAPDTRFGDFLRAYQQTSAALGPVSPQLAHLFTNSAATLGAFARERAALGAAIDAAPAAEAATTLAFRRVRPALDGLAVLSTRLRPAGRVLPATLRQINSTLTAGTLPLRQLPPLAGRLRTALVALDDFSRDPSTDASLRKLTDLVRPSNAVLGVLTPAQVYCNMLAGWGVGFSSTFIGIGAGGGPALPNLVLRTGGAKAEPYQSARPASNLGLNPVPHENRRECESGNEPWTGAQELNNPPGLQRRQSRATVPPPGVRGLARRAGLLNDPGRTR